MMAKASVRSVWDAVIIGGGHNALVAAAYLAGAGKSVLVLEKSRSLGGATKSERIFPDYDALLSKYAYLISLFPETISRELNLSFRTIRRNTASFTPWSDVQGHARGLVLSNIDPQRSRQSLEELTGGSTGWDGLQQLWELQQAFAALVWPSLLEPLRSRQQFAAMMESQQQKAAWRAFVERPLGEIIERLIDHDLLRGLVMTDAKIGVFVNPHHPSLLQNRCFLYHVIGGGNGEWRVPVGGMRALVDSLVNRCLTLGAEMLTEASAIRIDVQAKLHSVGFQWQDQEHWIEAEHVLVNAGPKCLAKLLDQPWQPDESDEGSVVKVNMLLKRLPTVKARGVQPEEAFSGSVHLHEGYDWMQESYRLAEKGVMPDPPPCEIYCHTLTDPSILSPELQAAGYQTLTLFGLDMPYRLFEQDHDARRAKILEMYLAAIQGMCAEPLIDCLATDKDGKPCVEVMTPQDLEREVGLDWGNIFHNSLSWFFTDNPKQVGTWGVETSIPRIYRAGSSALRGGAVSGIPGRCAAMCVLQNADPREGPDHQ
jgi:phytoene dehydrogenase-like protein